MRNKWNDQLGIMTSDLQKIEIDLNWLREYLRTNDPKADTLAERTGEALEGFARDFQTWNQRRLSDWGG